MSDIKQAHCHDLRKAASFVRRALLITFELPLITGLYCGLSISLSEVNYQETTCCTAVVRSVLLAVLSILLKDLSLE